ncbi:hypothetical protein [Burkholderia gladioli]|uniref:hypothetical protein n=1 Tax=Burkholderia gladioli TaxID=28095 RepID=UPI00163E4A00|nr:hypothetical protein [Burkholderia gladioli]
MNKQQKLGYKGQQRFGELCAEVGLTFNSSQVDLAGWDFIINFPDDESERADRRRTPLSCFVQVKTIEHATRSVVLKLNMAQRLALETLPSFICVLKVDLETSQFTDAFLIHVSGDRMSPILKRLRIAQADENSHPLNKIKISFTPKKFERIALTGEALRGAIVRHIGTDMHTYVEAKRQRREKLGYEEKPWKLSVEFPNLSDSDMLDVFLGRKQEVAVTGVEIVETRFSISIPEHEPTSGKISITPNPSDTCTVVVRRQAEDWFAIFMGDLIVAPIVNGKRRMLVRNELFSILFEGLGDSVETIRLEFAAGEQVCAPSVWADYWRLVSAVYAGDGIMEIKPASTRTSLVLKLIMKDLPDMSGLPPPQNYVRVMEALSKVARHAFMHPEPKFGYREILDQSNGILILAAMVTAKRQTVPITGQFSDAFSEIKVGRSVVAIRFNIGKVLFAFYAVADVEQAVGENGDPKILLHNFVPKKLRAFEDEKSIEAFFSDAQTEEGNIPILFF